MNVNRASFSTKARTWVLLAGLTALFIGVGYAIGGAALWFFVLFSVFMNVAAYWMSDKFAIRAARAQEVSEAEAPDLHHLIAELAQLYDVPKPRVYMIPSDQPNAFATGRNPEHAAVAVTQGLMQLMPRDQVRGVLAHEFAHIKNRDILVSSIAAMIAGAISAIGNIFFFMTIFGGDDDNNPIGAIGALLVMLVAPIAASLLQLAVSRQREFLADATAARMLGTGEPLAEALESLERGRQAMPMQVNPATEALYIVNPLKGAGVAALFSTHPPIDERIERLREYDRNRGIV
jgi:heat shock protein HtpX